MSTSRALSQTLYLRAIMAARAVGIDERNLPDSLGAIEVPFTILGQDEIRRS